MATPISGLTQKNPQNATNGRFIHNYSSFKDSLSRSRAYTARFGEYVPSFVFEGEPKDEISLNSVDHLDSMSLNSPFKGRIRKIKESFCVPKMAILPLNWDKIYVQPANGDDVPDGANCVIKGYPGWSFNFWSSLHFSCKNAAAVTSDADFCSFMTACCRMSVLGEYLYSEGSLLKYCGYSGSAQIEFAWANDPTYDGFFDDLMKALFSGVTVFGVHFKVGDTTVSRRYRGLSAALPSDVQYEKLNSFRDFLSDLRDDPSCVIYSVSHPGSEVASIQSAVKQNVLNRGFVQVVPAGEQDSDDDLKDMSPLSLNLSRLLAYQLVCAHFYSNSGVDFMYTAELYRQYFSSLWRLAYGSGTNDPAANFVWNGMSLPYDYLSGYVLVRLLFCTYAGSLKSFSYSVLSGETNSNEFDAMSAAFAAIFGFRRSLRFVDYFVGSRTRPLAPFNTDVAVNNDSVSVIDVTKRIQAQRFANAVMRTRSKIENYVKGLFGDAPAPDYHNPFLLAREQEVVFGDEVQNTADNLKTDYPNSRSALMASNGGRYTFTFHNDDNHPCIYLQIISFDIRRFYTRSVDRQMLQVNRYDMFNPDFQYIGDQPVYGIELGFHTDTNSIPEVFGYQGRDMEYKQNFDIALGGAIRRLNGWFMTDRNLAKIETPAIDSDFIRSYPSELDPFYLSLTGFSLATYFHFVINTVNSIDAKRAMAVDPQILA